ncbi:MAG TPA: peptidylprolyl isomerase [Betaproteobacteria bacterium]|nr:peptidylprolyl isomerase [Betaproteobacteria bacterium]
MHVEKNSVVSLQYELHEADGSLLEKSDETVSYLHGGYDGIFPKVEAMIQGKTVGDTVELTLTPADAFGDYDADLLRVESIELFPEDIQAGSRLEATAEGSDEMMLFTVTDIADGQVVVDGNHPLAGKTLRFVCNIVDVRPATTEEISHSHVHGPEGHTH